MYLPDGPAPAGLRYRINYSLVLVVMMRRSLSNLAASVSAGATSTLTIKFSYTGQQFWAGGMMPIMSTTSPGASIGKGIGGRSCSARVVRLLLRTDINLSPCTRGSNPIANHRVEGPLVPP
jgi:hypothetical protein